MCLTVYLVTDAKLAEVEWHKSAPDFHALRLKKKEKFLNSVEGANAFRLGSHEGCGCGFIADDDLPAEKSSATRTSCEKLTQFVAKALEPSGLAFVFAAWAGDESKTPTRVSVSIAHLRSYPWHETWDGPHLIEVLPENSLEI